MSKKEDLNYKILDHRTLVVKAHATAEELAISPSEECVLMYIDGANLIMDLLIEMNPNRVEIPAFSEERLIELAKIREHDAGYLSCSEHVKMFVAGANMVIDEISNMSTLDLEIEIRYMQVDREEPDEFSYCH